MSAPNATQLTGLGGLGGASANLQNILKAELIGVDLAAFSDGSGSAEALVRRDPGAATATLTFMKSGQSLPLPLELAKALIGQSTGSAQVAVEMAGVQSDGVLSATLKRLAAGPGNAASPLPAPPGAANFSSAAASLSLAAASQSQFMSPQGWSNAIDLLAPSALLDQLLSSASKAPTQANPSLGPTRETGPGSGADAPGAAVAARLEAMLSSLAPGAGVGYERALARIATMGPDMAAAATEALARFPQASGLDGSAAMLAQQVRAHEAGAIQWMGKAWDKAPMSVAWGAGKQDSAEAREALERCACQDQPTLAWMRLRIEPEGLGPIDVWAAMLGMGRCIVRLRCGWQAKPSLMLAKQGFSHLLEAARVDLAMDFDPEDGHERP